MASDCEKDLSAHGSYPVEGRVQVYKLKNDGEWGSMGVGYLSLLYAKSFSSHRIKVSSEHDSSKVILESAILMQIAYRLQEDAIIAWNEPGSAVELALSFESSSDCHGVWEMLNTIQERVSGDSQSESGFETSLLQNEEFCHLNSRVLSSSESDAETPSCGFDAEQEFLPIPITANIKEIDELLLKSEPSTRQRQGYITVLLSPIEKDQKDLLNDSGEKFVAPDVSNSETADESKIVSNFGGEDQSCRDANESESHSEKKPYLGVLLELFPCLESNNDLTSLYVLFSILRTLIFFNERRILELLLNPEYFEKVLGILEFSPIGQAPCRGNFRSIFKSILSQGMAVPIENKSVLGMVHRSFRIRFLRDKLVQRCLNDGVAAILTDMYTFLGFEIARALHSDDKYLYTMFCTMRDPEIGVNKRANVVASMKELCDLVKRMPIPEMNSFYRSLAEKSGDWHFFETFGYILNDQDSIPRERMSVCEILKSMLEYSPEFLRGYILWRESLHPKPPNVKYYLELSARTDLSIEDNLKLQRDQFANPAGVSTDDESTEFSSNELSILSQILKRLIFDPDPGVQAQACEILKLLLNPETMDSSDKETFLGLFYKVYAKWLVLPLELFKEKEHKYMRDMNLLRPSQGCIENRRPLQQSLETAHGAAYHVSELLSYFIQIHGFRVKYFLIQNSIVSKILLLLESREKYLVLSALRFIRTCVGLRDDFYNRHIVHFDILTPVLQLFVANGKRHNLIHSAIMDLLEFIRIESIRVLLLYIVERFEPLLRMTVSGDFLLELKDIYNLFLAECHEGQITFQNAHLHQPNQNDLESGKTTSDGEDKVMEIITNVEDDHLNDSVPSCGSSTSLVPYPDDEDLDVVDAENCQPGGDSGTSIPVTYAPKLEPLITFNVPSDNVENMVFQPTDTCAKKHTYGIDHNPSPLKRVNIDS